MICRTLMTGCVLILAAGCSSMPTSQTTKDLEVAPQYTQEEKDAMTEEEKVALYNESMSQDKNELVCRREHVVGSHFKQTVCKTREEIQAERESAQEAMRRGGGYGCPSGASSSGQGLCN